MVVCNQAGTYWVETTQGNCKLSDTVTIGFHAPPLSRLGNDTGLCDKTQWLLQAPDCNCHFEWSTGQSSKDISVNKGGTYWLKADNGYCTRTDTVKIDFSKSPMIGLAPYTVACASTPLILDAGKEGNSYEWSTGEKKQSISVSTGGLYWVKVSDGYCSSLDSTQVIYPNVKHADLGKNQYLCEDDGDTIVLSAGDFKSYTWLPNNEKTQQIRVIKCMEYAVTVEDEYGCRSSDTVEILRRCPPFLYVPNAFSPNSDGVNDIFLPVGQDITSYHLSIFNRWGEKIFESENLKTGWDGWEGDEHQPQSTYLYIITYEGYATGVNTTKQISGTVTLLR